jgi:RNA polymerase sigma-70 factor (ECF subfamily)
VNEVEKHYLEHLGHSTDKDLIFNELMNHYGEDVWNFAYFLTKRHHAAEDITQEVFLTVYDRLFTFRGECSIKSWLLTITRNKSLNYLNSAFVRKVLLVDYVQRIGSHASAETEVLEQLEVNTIWSAVLKLPRKYREMIMVSVHFKLSTSEIASMLDIAEGTVKSRLNRARKRLSELLSGDEGGERE